MPNLLKPLLASYLWLLNIIHVPFFSGTSAQPTTTTPNSKFCLSAPQTFITPNTNYYIMNQAAGTVMDVGACPSPGCGVVANTMQMAASQLWIFQPYSGPVGQYQNALPASTQLYNMINVLNQWCLNDPYNGITQGTQMIIWPFGGVSGESYNELFGFTYHSEVADQGWQFSVSSNGYSVDLASGTPTNGSAVEFHADLGNVTAALKQRWAFIISEANCSNVFDNTGTLSPSATLFCAYSTFTFTCLSGLAVPPQYNTQTMIYTCQANGTWSPQFQPCQVAATTSTTASTMCFSAPQQTIIANTSYYIINQATGNVMDAGSCAGPGCGVVVNAPVYAAASQQWIFYPYSDTGVWYTNALPPSQQLYAIVSVLNQYWLNDPENSFTAGTQMILWPSSGPAFDELFGFTWHSEAADTGWQFTIASNGNSVDLSDATVGTGAPVEFHADKGNVTTALVQRWAFVLALANCTNVFDTSGTVSPAAGTLICEGSEFTFTCLAGRAVPPPHSTQITNYTCQADGTWAPAFKTCQTVCNPIPTSPTNGNVAMAGVTSTPLNNAYFINSTATFTCNAGWQISSAAVVTCLANGSWSAPFPTCQPTNPYLCPPLTLANGTVTGAPAPGATLGTVATYACDACFTMQGTSTTTCVQPAQNQPYAWNSVTPTCIANQCNNIFNTATGTIAASPYFFNTTYTFTCNANYALLPTGQTSMIYTCGCTGTWSSPFQACTLVSTSPAPTLTTPAPTVATPAPLYDSWSACCWLLWLLIMISMALLVGIYLYKKYLSKDLSKSKPETSDKSASASPCDRGDRRRGF